jgi:transposase
LGRRTNIVLRNLTREEETTLQRLSKATSERVDTVRRAKALIAVAGGKSLTQAAQEAGFKSSEAVSQLVERFNTQGLHALSIAPGRGRKATYDSQARVRILQEVQREPDREKETTATWSLKILEKTLRKSDLPRVGATTIGRVLHEAGYSVQQSRTWCLTGTAQRKRKAGVVTVRDPHAEKKKDGSNWPIE